ncbi:DoxX family protein [Breoghania sp.]|uniref:DoxX family protein n=1 Tax=Breoghania sp. TaxID=2065378 RepID=UPI002AA730C4|nr:DoxX family protein [Breoghania sp.]
MDIFDKFSTQIQLAGRLLIAYIFVVAGWGKIAGYAGTAAYMESQGIPGALLPLVIATELGGGLLVAVGFQTRIAAFLLAGFSIVSAVLFHYLPADQGQMISFMKNLAMAGGFLFIVANGPGAWSLDAFLGGNRRSAAA